MDLNKPNSIRESLAGIYKSYFNPNTRRNDGIGFTKPVITAEALSHDIIPQYSVQNLFRPLFGKGPAQAPTIGDHPDFVHLKGTKNQERCPIVTLFMDIESSTRLGILYEPEDVHRIKNAFICIAIEIVKSFDGHVHRIMGDSVMAFFGGKNFKTENAVIDALNTASLIHFFVEKVIVPNLEAENYKDAFGIRIGIDYGPKDKVLWSSYGYPGIDEVTATSFFVDIASKLQHSAGRNQIMIGQSLMQYIDFPDIFLKTKTYQQNGEEKPEYYIQPNHTDRQGRYINYIQKIFLWEDYLRYTPLGQSNNSGLSKTFDSNFISVRAELYTSDRTQRIDYLGSCTKFIPKHLSIKFIVRITDLIQYPLKVILAVQNHGKEATDANELSHHTILEIKTCQEAKEIQHWEFSGFRGLHFLNVTVETFDAKKYLTSYGVYIE